MHRRTLIVTLAPMAALLLSAAIPSTQPGDDLLAPRIRAHFDSVLAELRQRDVNALTPSQRARRSVLVRRLERYRDRGVFPHNYDFPGQAVPYFVDRKTGTLCAVAHLLASTGRRDVVQRVAAADNNVWVMELKGDAAFEAWLRDNGLTLEEAARIQVPYEVPDPPPAMRSTRLTATPALVGLSAAGVAGINLLTNRDGHGRLRNWGGIASGAASLAVGAALMRDTRHPSMALTNAGLGVLSAAISAKAMFERRASSLETRRDAAQSRVAVAPVLPTSETGTGLSISLRF